MLWLKRNLFLVVGGVVALVLLGVGGWLLLRNLDQEKAITEQYGTLTNEFRELVTKDPHPGTPKVDNIGAAKKDHERLQALLEEAKKHFVSLEYPTNVDAGKFKLMLENTIYELQREATNSGVKFPAKFNFTFSAQRTILNFAAGSPEPMAHQLMDLKAICQTLFAAKVHEVTGLRRCRISTDDVSTSEDFLSNKPTTNDLVILTPYEVTFKGFSRELSEVLEGLYKAPQCFIVKNVTVEKGDPITTQPELPPPGTMPIMPGAGGMSPMMMQRYGGMMGRGNPYGGGARFNPYMNMPGAAPPPPPERKGLDENPLKVTLLVEVARLKPAEKPGDKPAASRPSRVPAAPPAQ